MTSVCLPLAGAAVSHNVHQQALNNNSTNVFDCCVRCGFSGGDVRISGCGCVFHTRCVCLPDEPLSFCPHCKAPSCGMTLIPMSFRELDDAKKSTLAVANYTQTNLVLRKKRKIPGEIVGPDEKLLIEDSDQRTGRWTPAETAYVDELISKFETGMIPIGEGMKLNDFLASILQCKQSRLTKKMKNAKLSSRAFKRSTGHIQDVEDAREFSGIEEAFFYSIHRVEERAEMKFHMQKQWREMFCIFCSSVNQVLDADEFANSVEEIQRRAAMVRDAARLRRRELMMALALQKDKLNPNAGAIIDMSNENQDASIEELNNEDMNPSDDNVFFCDSNLKKTCSPYLDEIMKYMERSNVPFEHVDAWVPSFVPPSNIEWAATGNPKCRLCFAGCVTAEMQSQNRRQQMTHEEHFNLETFGQYTQKFSFDIGCGLPGRVYQNGVATWEQSVQNAPLEHFERCGGAIQCGVRTVVGIPVPSPNVGRIVVILYSCYDRQKDQELVARLIEEFTKLLPSPRWQLIVDLDTAHGAVEKTSTALVSRTQQSGVPKNKVAGKSSRVEAVVNLLGEYMPSQSSSPLYTYLPGFMSLRLLILRSSRSDHEEELLQTMLDSYESYTTAGRSPSDIALLLARDCMFVTQQPYSQQLITTLPQKTPMHGTSTANYKSHAHPVQQTQSTSSGSTQMVWNPIYSQVAPVQGHRPATLSQSHSLPQHNFLPAISFKDCVSQGNGAGERNSETCKNSLPSQQFHSSNPGGSQI